MNDNIKDLKPCPWCKNEKLLHSRGDEMGHLHWVSCSQCRAEGPVGTDWDEAAGLWNTRQLTDWQSIEEVKPAQGQIVIVAAGPRVHGQYVAAQWDGREFAWVEEMEGFGLGELPSEVVSHWMPWPDDPE